MGNQVLPACGVAAGPLFTATYLLVGTELITSRFTTPSVHLPWGPAGRAQTVSFISAGLLSLALSVGLWHAGPTRWGALLVGIWAVALMAQASSGRIQYGVTRPRTDPAHRTHHWLDLAVGARRTDPAHLNARALPSAKARRHQRNGPCPPTGESETAQARDAE